MPAQRAHLTILDLASLAPINPRLVYVSITGHASVR
jgi:crotonobetainyl-CoA:carnitine CoA-transferase CaiB-like acyl-CoA transferase